jgi:hypothetical protein
VSEPEEEECEIQEDENKKRHGMSYRIIYQFSGENTNREILGPYETAVVTFGVTKSTCFTLL